MSTSKRISPEKSKSKELLERDLAPWMAPHKDRDILFGARKQSLDLLFSNCPTQRNRFYQNGFTLLEVLIALFIFTIVSMIIVSGMHTVFTTQTATEKNSARIAELQVAFTLLQRDFEQSINRNIINASGTREASFIGGHDNVTFTHAGYANPLGQALRSTLQRTRYRLVQGNLIRETWYALDQAMQSLPEQRTILSDVKELRFEFLDQHNRFQDRWPPPDQTDNTEQPLAIRISVTLNDLGKISQLYILPGQKIDKPTP